MDMFSFFLRRLYFPSFCLYKFIRLVFFIDVIIGLWGLYAQHNVRPIAIAWPKQTKHEKLESAIASPSG